MRARKITDYGVKTHTCICPKCHREHKQTFFWSGAGRPRKFCPDCQYFVGEYDSRPDHSPAGKVKNQPPDLTAGEFNRGE